MRRGHDIGKGRRGANFRDTLNALRSMDGRQYIQHAVVIDVQLGGERSANGL